MQDLKPFSPDYNKKFFLPQRKATFSFLSSLLSLLWKSRVGDLDKSEE